MNWRARMNLVRYLGLAVAVLALWPGAGRGQFFGLWRLHPGDDCVTLTVKPDGSCVLTNESVEPRESLEARVAAWERSSSMAEGPGAEGENPPPAVVEAAKPPQKVLTDEELAAKIRELYQEQSSFGPQAGTEIEKVEVSTNSMRVVTRRGFGSLKELLSVNPYFWGPNLLLHDEVRFETDTNRNLRITFSPVQDAARYRKTQVRDWKAAKGLGQ